MSRLKELQPSLPRVSATVATLSPEARALLQLVATGMTDKEIASELGWSLKTVAYRVGKLRSQLGVETRIAAARQLWEVDLAEAKAKSSHAEAILRRVHDLAHEHGGLLAEHLRLLTSTALKVSSVETGTPKPIAAQSSVSLDALRLAVYRSGQFEGIVGTYWAGRNGKWTAEWPCGCVPEFAKVGFLRKGWKEPMWAVAPLHQYQQFSPLWAAEPAKMLARAAEKLGYETFFSEEIKAVTRG